MPASAVDVVSIAFEHTKEQLFRPFRLGQWTRLAIVGLLAGELGAGGGFSNGFSMRGRNGPQHLLAQAIPPVNILLVLAIACLAIAGIILFIALIYVSSMMRFVLFDSIVAKECHIRRFWSRRVQPGFRYFVWQIVFIFSGIASIFVLAGFAAVFVFGFGLNRNPREHLLPLVLAGIVFVAVFLALIFTALLVHVLTKDFVVPQMALDDVSAIEGWRRLWPMLTAEKAGYAGYVGLKILLSIGAAVALGIAILISVIGVLIPVGIVGVIVFLIARSMGLVWNVYTIAVAVVAGGVTGIGLAYLFLLLTAPLSVFFPAYAIHFFSSRYPALHAALHPEVSQ